MGIVSGVIGVVFHLNNMKLNDIASSFKDGAKDLIGAALVVAMAQGIMQVLGGSDPTTPTVINTVIPRLFLKQPRNTEAPAHTENAGPACQAQFQR